MDEIPYHQLNFAITVISPSLMYRLEQSRVGLEPHGLHRQDVHTVSADVATRRDRPPIYGFIRIFTAMFLPDGLATLPARAQGWTTLLCRDAAPQREDR